METQAEGGKEAVSESVGQGSLLVGDVTQCKLLVVLLAAADLISSSCRLNDNQISLNSVFFLAQSLSTLERIKTMNLRYGQEYFSYFFAI